MSIAAHAGTARGGRGYRPRVAVTVFGTLSAEAGMRHVIPSGAGMLLALQAAHGAFYLSVLELGTGERRGPGGS